MRLQIQNREQYFTNAEITETIMKNYLTSIEPTNQTNLWYMKYSEENGRGVYAQTDLPYGTAILIDGPIIHGPRLSAHLTPLCTVCYRKTSDLILCEQQCGLPVCSIECSKSELHDKDCGVIKTWMEQNKREKFKKWSPNLLRSLTAVRGLHLSQDQMEVALSLQGHIGEQHGVELNFLKSEGLIPSQEEEEYIRSICCILDTNAFETVVKSPESNSSLRGLYPMGALLNHSCVPNTTHLFDLNQRMILKTTRLVRFFVFAIHCT